MHERMHTMDQGSSSSMLDQRDQKGYQQESFDGVLSVKEQMLLALFRRLSVANQERVLRCAEVLSQVPDE